MSKKLNVEAGIYIQISMRLVPMLRPPLHMGSFCVHVFMNDIFSVKKHILLTSNHPKTPLRRSNLRLITLSVFAVY